MAPILAPILGLAGKVADKFFEDKDKKNEFMTSLTSEVLKNEADIVRSQASIINAESNGSSWLQRSWRPLTMLTFVSLIVAKWLGFTVDGVSEAIELELLSIIKVGLGGYVVGRSAEKVATVWKK